MVWDTVFAGFLGGCAAELLQWFKIRKDLHNGIPDWSKNYLYWLVTFFMALAGGGLVYAYQGSGSEINLILALNIGASAPLLLGTIVKQTPDLDPGTVD